MAGVLKARDIANALKTATAFKGRDSSNTLRTALFLRIRDPGNILREVFTAGGGGASNPTSITPGSYFSASQSYYYARQFTAMSSGGAPSSYSWGLLSGSGGVASGGATSIATLAVYADSSGDPTTAIFYCDMVIGGTTYRATCSLTHEFLDPGDPYR